ncbi:hypothetical protein L873DRAFT_1738328, partial [Choiromyces venosus 120613-1]
MKPLDEVPTFPSFFCTISICQTSDNMAYTGNAYSFNNNNSCFNTIIQAPIPVVDEKAQLLQWLSPLEPRQRHKHLRESRLDGVGEWIFRTREFERWNTVEDGSTHPVLFCHGDPGVGKTHL